MTWQGVADSGTIYFSTDDQTLFDFSELNGDVKGGLLETRVSGIAGYALPVGNPQTDQIIKFDGSQWTYAPDASGSSNLQGHELLSFAHTDTIPGTAQRGDIVVGTTGNVWTRLALGTQGFVLYSDGTDAQYTRLGQNTPFESGSVSAPSVTFEGDLDTGWYNSDFNKLSAAASGLNLLTINGQNGSINISAGQVVKTRTVGASTTASATDYVIASTAAPVTVTLPASPEEGQVLIIKDRDGSSSGANRITIGGNGNTIDGNPNIQIKQRYGSFTLLYSGTEWNVI